MSKALARALERRREAEDKVGRTLRRDYPLGGKVEWKRNGLHEGIVLLHGYEDRIKVRNVQSGHEVWIYAYCIVEAWDRRCRTHS
jgi:hypothetical protein